MGKAKGFLIAESVTGLMITVIGVSILALIVAQSQKVEMTIEAKTDHAYAWHIMKEQKIKSIKVHDHLYELKGKSVYDAQTRQEYRVK